MIVSLATELFSIAFVAFRNLAVLAVVFTSLATILQACNDTPPWWRKPDLLTDIAWVLLTQYLGRIASVCLLFTGIIVFYGLQGDQVGLFLTEGRGVLGHIGFWPQVVLYLLGADLVMYATHRLFHTAQLWRYHAVHHSSQHLEWVSSSRFHPVDFVLHGVMADVVMLLLGIPPEVIAWLMPFTVGLSALVHANLDWDFGWGRYLLVGPVYHRWHHTNADRGGSSNFAATFPLFDLVFGTFYMPAGQRPDRYGVDDPRFPPGFLGQLRHPFRPQPSPVLEAPARADAHLG